MMFKYGFRLIALAVTLVGGLAEAQPGVHLKAAAGGKTREASTAARRLAGDRWHMLLVFASTPREKELAQLQSVSIRVLQYVPDRGLLASVPETAPLEGIELEWIGRLRPDQKLSPLLLDRGVFDSEEAATIIADFHGDVSAADALAILHEEGLHLVENPDLLPSQRIVQGPGRALAKLADWDEVAYLFPISPELSSHNPVDACAGAVTASGLVGQLVAKVGDGWDGPGKGAAALKYFFSSYTGRIAPELVRSESLRAMQEWARHVQLQFQQANSATDSKTINILFATGQHGDGYPFDGPGKTLAHTFYPAPPNPESIAGDLHLDDDESWQVGAGTDLFSVVLHELGHALGLGHSDNPNAVMYPYYRRVTQLNTEDIEAIRELYATASATTPSTPTNPTTPAPTPEPLQLSVNAVASVTASGQIDLSGTTSGGTGTVQVSWVNNRGGAGTAQGYRPWTASGVILQTGENMITLTATDTAQRQATQQVRVTRETAPAQPPAQSLFVRIASPAAGNVVTDRSTIALSGTAGPDGTIARLFWVNARGSGGSAAGSSNWTTSPIALEAGTNRITVTVANTQGQTASAVLDVEYTPPAPVIDTVAPTLVVTSPTQSSITTASTNLTITGTASDNVWVREVDYTGSGNRSGKAIGTTDWRFDYALVPGINSITIRAFDNAGNMSWRSLTITRR